MTNEQQAAYLKLLRDDLENAMWSGQQLLAKDHPETIGFFRALNTTAFQPIKELIKRLDRQIETLTPTRFP